MPKEVLVLLASAGSLIGAGLLLWFIVHLWVAMRVGARLERKDYVQAAAGAAMVVGGIFVLLYYV